MIQVGASPLRPVSLTMFSMAILVLFFSLQVSDCTSPKRTNLSFLEHGALFLALLAFLSALFLAVLAFFFALLALLSAFFLALLAFLSAFLAALAFLSACFWVFRRPFPVAASISNRGAPRGR